ncbi:MAG TPA: FAD-dependent oxidoreductase [Patescibacteria group bacterium]|nr:FAD-dependent oxidoreductase [Patescibacteria group bacterium]
MYDVIIIGNGPAGMTAAIYTARKKLKTLVLGALSGGQMIYSNEIDNYTGFDLITGPELTEKFQQHIAHVKEDVEILSAEVIHIEKVSGGFSISDKERKKYAAKALIIASGRQPKRLGIPGEEKFLGKGVAVCTTCDAPLFKGKDVVVVGGGNSAMDALLALSRSCRTVYGVNINKELQGDEIMKTKIHATPNIRLFPESELLEISGYERPEKVRIKKHDGGLTEVEAQGVFIEIGWTPSVAFDSLTEKNEFHEIKVNGNLETSVPGIFAAGDVNDCWGEQIIIAAGEGAKAAMAVSKYIHRLK